jgi:hypothetical protein
MKLTAYAAPNRVRDAGMSKCPYEIGEVVCIVSMRICYPALFQNINASTACAVIAYKSTWARYNSMAQWRVRAKALRSKW